MRSFDKILNAAAMLRKMHRGEIAYNPDPILRVAEEFNHCYPGPARDGLKKYLLKRFDANRIDEIMQRCEEFILFAEDLKSSP